jgi:hypothetical protein
MPGFSFIAMLTTAALSHRNPAPAGTSNDSCGVHDSNKEKHTVLYCV